MQVRCKYDYKTEARDKQWPDSTLVSAVKADVAAWLCAETANFELMKNNIFLLNDKEIRKYRDDAPTGGPHLVANVMNMKRKFKVDAGGKIFSFTEPESSTIGNLKKAVAQKGGVEGDGGYNLEYNGEVLNDSRTVGCYHIYSETPGQVPMVMAITKQRGG